MSKKILITGGTGSFGNAFSFKIINSSNYSEINIFSRDEKNNTICVRNFLMKK